MTNPSDKHVTIAPHYSLNFAGCHHLHLNTAVIHSSGMTECVAVVGCNEYALQQHPMRQNRVTQWQLVSREEKETAAVVWHLQRVTKVG